MKRKEKKRMRKVSGTICMILGVLLIGAAAVLFGMNRREAKEAAEAAEAVLPQLVEKMEKNAGKEDPETGEENPLPDPYDPEMREEEIGGERYVGYLSIPSLGLELPVISEWSYERLKTAPCRYAGSSKTGDLVIAAHNYARHFGRLAEISPGAEVYFTDMDGVVSAYEVIGVEELGPSDVEEMTAGEYDLTLFTCTYTGRSRVTVRCSQKKS